jgi:hypothetical protein
LEFASLHRECEEIDRAVIIGQQQAWQQHQNRVRATFENGGADDWRELIRQTAVTIAMLRGLNRRRAELKKKLSYGGAGPNLPCDGFRLFGADPIIGDEVYRFFEAAIREGIVTKREIDHAAD